MTDVEAQVLGNPKLRAMMDQRDLEMLKRRAVLEKNKAFTDLLSPDIRNDYLSYIRLNVGDPDKVELWRAELVARYLGTASMGRWKKREWNIRASLRGSRERLRSRLYHADICDEDIAAMENNAVLHKPTPTPEAASEANQKFAEATRQASFSLALGVREIRLLAAQPWKTTRWLQAEYTAGLQRLIEKGLLIHEIGSPPMLSEAGELVRRMLVVSRHIVEKPGDDGL